MRRFDVKASDWIAYNTRVGNATVKSEDFGPLSPQYGQITPAIANLWDDHADYSMKANMPRTLLDNNSGHPASRIALDSVSTSSWQNSSPLANPPPRQSAATYTLSALSGGAAAAFHPWPSGTPETAMAGEGCYAEGGRSAEEGVWSRGAWWGFAASPQVHRHPHLSPACQG